MSDSLSSGVSTNGVKTYLDKEQLQQLDAFGRRILSQQTEHNNRVRRLHGLEAQSGDNEELDSEIRERHRELTEMAKAWDEDNAQLTQPLSLKPVIVSAPLQASRADDIPQDPGEHTIIVENQVQTHHIPEEVAKGTELQTRDIPKKAIKEAGVQWNTPPKATKETEVQMHDIPQDSERSKVTWSAAVQTDDGEFVSGAENGLPDEVRRLQSVLGERDKVIQDIKEEKGDLEKTIESLRSGLQAQEQSADKFKEENLNLEATLQGLRAQLSDSQASIKRLESDHERLTNLLVAARKDANQARTENEGLKIAFDEFKAKRETDSVCRTTTEVPPVYTSGPIQNPTTPEKKPSWIIMLWESTVRSLTRGKKATAQRNNIQEVVTVEHPPTPVPNSNTSTHIDRSP